MKMVRLLVLIFSLLLICFSVTFPTAPHIKVTAKGDIICSEVVCENVHKLEPYIEEMASSDTVSETLNIQKV
jgi:fatty acid synthase subunit alpha